MINEIVYYRSPQYDPYYNQGVERYFLENIKEGQLAFYLWQNYKTVFIGRNQNAYVELDQERLESDGGHLARRLSGGGAVYHEIANLNFTFCAFGNDYDVVRQSMVIVDAMKKLGLAAELSGRNDITIDGAKFSGNAYYSQGGQKLHHGTILIDVNTENMSKYLRPSQKKLKSKGVASVRSRVVNLKQLMPDIDIDMLAVALKEAVKDEYQAQITELDSSDFDTEKLKRYIDFFADREWQRGKHVSYTLQSHERFDWGEVQVNINLDAGKVSEAQLFSDANDANNIKEIESIINSQHMSISELVEYLSNIDLKDDQNNAIKQDIAQLIKDMDV